MGPLTVRLTRRFTADMDALRGSGWTPPAAGPARDEFDARSHHLVVASDGRAVGMVRITRAYPSVLSHWSAGAAPLPRGPRVAELTRGVVAAPWRRLGLYRLAMLESVLRLRALGVWLATAAVELEFPGRAFLADMGFVDMGRPVVFDDAPRSRTLAQAIMLEIDAEGEARWEKMWRRQVDDLVRAGCEVDSTLWAVDSMGSGDEGTMEGPDLVHDAARGDHAVGGHGQPGRP